MKIIVGMMNNKTWRHIAQTTLEMTLAIAALFLLLIGAARIFFWLTSSTVAPLRVLPEEAERTDLPTTFQHSDDDEEVECQSCETDLDCILLGGGIQQSCFSGCCRPFELKPQ